MSFDAGTVKARLDLDTTDFKHGFEEAHTHAETEGGRVREIFESIAEVASEVAGPAFAQFGQQLQSAFAGFSEGPAIGVLNLVGLAAGAIREAVEGAGGAFHQMGLEAEKAGVSAEFLSRLTAVGGTVGVGLDQLSTGFKILQQRAEEASQGNTKTAEAFAALGISAQQAGELAKDPEKLFTAVQDALQGIPIHAKEVTDALAVMGRGGANLVPLFSMTREEFNKTADEMQRLGGTVSEQDVEMGEAMGKLEGYFHSAMLGIKRALAVPVLNYLHEHMSEIEPKMEALTTNLVNGIVAGWGYAVKAFDEGKHIVEVVQAVFERWSTIIKGDAIAAFTALKPIIDAVSDTFKENMPLAENLGKSFMALAGIVGGELWSEIKKVASMLGGEFNISWKGIIPAIADVIKYMSHLESVVLKDLTKAMDFLRPYMAGLAAAMSYIADVAVDVMGPSLHVSVVAIEAILAVLKKLNDLLENAVSSTFEAFTADVHAVGTAIDWAEGKASAFLHAIEGLASIGPLNLLGGVGGGLGAAVGTSAAGGQGGGGGGGGGGGAVQNVHVAVNFDQRDSVNQLAAKLMTPLRQMRKDHADQLAGAAAIAMAQASMGGDA